MVSDRYRDVLEDDFLLFLQGMGVQFEMFFQQDGARSHAGKALLDGVSILTIMLSQSGCLHDQTVYGLVLATIFSHSQPLRSLFVAESESRCVQKQLYTVVELKNESHQTVRE